MTRLLTIGKEPRTQAVMEHVRACGYQRIVCLSSGNAVHALQHHLLANRVIDVDLVGVGTDDQVVEVPLRTARWLRPAEITKLFGPHTFDATPGHLPVDVMMRVGELIRYQMRRDGQVLDVGGAYAVPTGSGETVCSLAMAYPDVLFTALVNCGPGTEWDERNVLAPLVKRLVAGLEVGTTRVEGSWPHGR